MLKVTFAKGYFAIAKMTKIQRSNLEKINVDRLVLSMFVCVSFPGPLARPHRHELKTSSMSTLNTF